MTSLAKIIGGGFPIGAYGGRRDIMALTDPSEGPPRVSHAGTFNGNPVSAAAGRVSLELLTPEAFERLDVAGAGLERAVREAIEESGAPFSLNRTSSLLYMDFAPPEGAEGPTDWAALAPLVRRRLPTAWLAHGLLGSAINATTVMTDDQIAEVGRRFTNAMSELMRYLGDHLPEAAAAGAGADAALAIG
jgi:glutamate-1-semialdehyde 2,1-aminomutase